MVQLSQEQGVTVQWCSVTLLIDRSLGLTSKQFLMKIIKYLSMTVYMR